MALSARSLFNQLIGPGPLLIDNLFHDTGALAANLVIDVTYPNFLKIDPNGARNVTLPPEKDGLFYAIVNYAGGAENISLLNDAGGAVATINQNDLAIVFCDGGAWVVFCVIATAQS